MCQPWQLNDSFLSIAKGEWTNPKGKWIQKTNHLVGTCWELGVISFLVAVVMHGSINWNPDMPHAHSCEFHHGQSSSNLLSGLFEFEPSVKQTKCHGLTVVLRSSFVPKASCQRHDTLQAPPQSTQRWVVDLKHLRGSTLVQWAGNSNRQAFKLRHKKSHWSDLIGRSHHEVEWRVLLIFVVLIWRSKKLPALSINNKHLTQVPSTSKKNSMRNMVAWWHHNMPKSWVSQTIRREFP